MTKAIGHCIDQISDLEHLIPDQYFLEPAGFKMQMIPSQEHAGHRVQRYLFAKWHDCVATQAPQIVRMAKSKV